MALHLIQVVTVIITFNFCSAPEGKSLFFLLERPEFLKIPVLDAACLAFALWKQLFVYTDDGLGWGWSWHWGHLPYVLFKTLKCSCSEILELCWEAKSGWTDLKKKKKIIYSRQKFLIINVEVKQHHRWQVFKAKARAALREGGNQAHPPPLD